jgi:hypothetical protein
VTIPPPAREHGEGHFEVPTRLDRIDGRHDFVGLAHESRAMVRQEDHNRHTVSREILLLLPVLVGRHNDVKALRCCGPEQLPIPILRACEKTWLW